MVARINLVRDSAFIVTEAILYSTICYVEKRVLRSVKDQRGVHGSVKATDFATRRREMRIEVFPAFLMLVTSL